MPRSRRSSLPLDPRRVFALLVALLVLVFLMGGGSRHDIASLPWLRALACLAAAAGVIGLDRATLRAYRVPFLLLAALALLMAVQLVPLPPSLWTHLPSREAIQRLDVAVGLSDVWRPITVSPMKTANALASLVVPLAVLVLFCRLDEARQRWVLMILVWIAVVGTLLGILQVLAGADSGLYFYAITHKGAAVGFFANRNHHTAFLAAAMLIALHLATERPGTERAPVARDTVSLLSFAAAVVLFVGVVGNISRGGLLSAGVALVLVPLVVSGSPADAGRRRAGRLASRWVKAAVFALPAFGILLLFALTQRSPALTRLLADGQGEDPRAQILPTVLAMARDYQPWGAGFGAFEYAYRMHEPAALLVPNYFNNAHDDWLQFAIEGGVPALLVAGALAAAIAARLLRLARKADRIAPAARSRAWLGFAVLAVIGFASLFDYPLRVPAIMAVAVIALALLIGPVLEQNQRNACGPQR